MSLVGSFKHLPDSRGTQITAYFCMQFASKSSSLISCILHGNSQPISLSFRVLKMCKIQRKNILKRPISIKVNLLAVNVGYLAFYHLWDPMSTLYFLHDLRNIDGKFQLLVWHYILWQGLCFIKPIHIRFDSLLCDVMKHESTSINRLMSHLSLA